MVPCGHAQCILSDSGCSSGSDVPTDNVSWLALLQPLTNLITFSHWSFKSRVVPAKLNCSPYGFLWPGPGCLAEADVPVGGE